MIHATYGTFGNCMPKYSSTFEKSISFSASAHLSLCTKHGMQTLNLPEILFHNLVWVRKRGMVIVQYGTSSHEFNLGALSVLQINICANTVFHAL